MQTSRKQQGFIIRKGRKIEGDKQERKKFMSQTQFYKKPQLQTAFRSPGSILHIKNKEDIGMIRSSKSRWGQNPQNSRLHDLKYNFEETEHNLRQIGQQHYNKNLGQLQLGVIQSRVQRIPGLDLERNIQLVRILQELNYRLHHRLHSSQTLKTIKSYLDFITEHELGSVNSLNIPVVRKKLLKQSLINQRVAILLIGFIEVNNLFETYKSYVINLAMYAHENLLLRLITITQASQKVVIELLKQQGKESLLSRGYQTIKNNNQIMSQSILKVSKADNLLYQNLKKIIKSNKTLHVKGQFSAIQEYFAFFMHVINKDQMAPFLALAPIPYLPVQDFNKYTLVIDIIQCFCSHSKKSIQSFRPYAQYFLDEMSQYFEIVSFCDAMPNQINKVISLIDRKKHIKHRLYRHHLDKTKSFNGKDLARLGRDINTVVLIDTSLHSNPNSTIVVNPWKGRKNDAQLAQLCPILAMLALKKLNPQKTIKKLHEKNEENQKLGLKYQNFGIDLQ